MRTHHGQRTERLLTTMVVAASVLFCVGSPATAEAALKTPTDKYVRTANYYLKAGTDITAADYPALAAYDLLIFPAEAQIYNRVMFPRLRELNPNILILAYVPSKSFNYAWVDPLHQKMSAGIEQSWWLRSAEGSNVSVWPGTAVINSVSGWSEYLPNFVKTEIMDTGLWDGVFYDEFSVTASWMNGGNVDSHNDGIRDDARLLDTAWERSSINLLQRTRDLIGRDKIIVTNGDSTGSIQKFVNGRMFETFPTPWEAGGSWEGVMANYVNLHRQVGYDPVFVINANTGNSGNSTDYRKVRYGLASTLLADGFFSFDFGESSHGQLWRYDEQDVALGRPLGGPVNMLASNGDNRIRNSVWRRDFQNGVAIVNSTNETRTVQLGGELEKIRGNQDPSVNNGAIVTSVTLQPNDGLLLRKRIEQVVGTTFPNGAFVNVYSPVGVKARNGFFSYDEREVGSASVIKTDLGNNGQVETVSAANGSVTVRNSSGAVTSTFKAFGDAYRGPVNVAVGDLDGDGLHEIIVGAGPGGGPQIRIFNTNGKLLHPGFFAYDAGFRGGVHVAVGDLYGTGQDVIIAGAGAGGGPHVRIFNKNGRVINPGFFAYDSRFRGGVNVAVGDLDGDGFGEIVTGPGLGGGPHVRVFNRYGVAQGKGFMAADANSRNGIAVGVTDTDGNGTYEIAAFAQ